MTSNKRLPSWLHLCFHLPSGFCLWKDGRNVFPYRNVRQFCRPSFSPRGAGHVHEPAAGGFLFTEIDVSILCVNSYFCDAAYFQSTRQRFNWMSVSQSNVSYIPSCESFIQLNTAQNGELIIFEGKKWGGIWLDFGTSMPIFRIDVFRNVTILAQNPI